ncbi:MAG TPA: AAA family ATPase [Sphingopyxis sp.]|uniref:AAA family ATPase n=1 Tax=Sphingopyxis sp. TaxID=1908224 RepID=UPI002E33EB2A|nr:AAA family ATPase [Sphingopyxis sp.]HEX2811102.1 AAA family ATPase [Sphingopyxis sp.]
MYAKSLAAYDFRCFGKAKLDFQYPGRETSGASELNNVNLILGDNGGGKSSILRAVAIAVLAPVLQETGFVAYRMVRRPDCKSALLRVDAIFDGTEYSETSLDPKRRSYHELVARFEARENSNRDRLSLEKTPNTPVAERIYDDYSPAFFVVGYGATRRVETSDYSESSARRQRGLRYHRVAGLFEDHIAVRPLQSWFPKLRAHHRQQALGIINSILPSNIRFEGKFDEGDQQFLFLFGDNETPFSSLSDGYKAFIGMAGDLIGHLADVCPDGASLTDISGVVLIDEIDLHLHPEWQRTILPTLARSFPSLQFICTTHSPLVASAVRKENIFITADADDGTATVKQIEENVFGRSAEQILLSSYFGLESTRSQEFVSESEQLLKSAASGDKEAALTFLDRLAAPALAQQELVGLSRDKDDTEAKDEGRETRGDA